MNILRMIKMSKAIILMNMFAIFLVYGLCSMNIYKMIIMILLAIVCLLSAEYFLDKEYEKYINEKTQS